MKFLLFEILYFIYYKCVLQHFDVILKYKNKFLVLYLRKGTFVVFPWFFQTILLVFLSTYVKCSREKQINQYIWKKRLCLSVYKCLNVLDYEKTVELPNFIKRFLGNSVCLSEIWFLKYFINFHLYNKK